MQEQTQIKHTDHSNVFMFTANWMWIFVKFLQNKSEVMTLIAHISLNNIWALPCSFDQLLYHHLDFYFLQCMCLYTKNVNCTSFDVNSNWSVDESLKCFRLDEHTTSYILSKPDKFNPISWSLQQLFILLLQSYGLLEFCTFIFGKMCSK